MSSCIAAQLYTLRDFLTTPADVATTLQRVKAIGYEAVQLSGLGPIAPEELATILQGEGLVPVITHIGFQRLDSDLEAVIAEHKLWGCPHVAIGGMPGEYRSREGYVAFAKWATTLAQRLAIDDLTFSYHNHSFEFEKFDGKTGMELLFDAADFLVKAELDTYWVQHGGANPVTWIQKFTGRIAVMHFKDMGFVNGNQAMAEVGEGNLEWPAIIAACRAAGVEWYAVEQDVCQRDPFESLTISLRNLKAMGLE
jgi:sugar phosphate isomerase/epimerase